MGRKPKQPDPPPPVLMGLREYARHREQRGLVGTTHRAVQVALRDGRIVKGHVNGKIDPRIADEEWSATTLESRVPRTGPTAPAKQSGEELPEGVPKLHESRARREAAEAELAEIELEEKLGELVQASEVEAKLVSVFANCQKKLLAVPSRVRQRDPGLSAEQIELIDTAIREALEDLAGAAVVPEAD